jgi:hypothetical protein
VETSFQTGKIIGLDEPQVRRWHSWYRHTTLVMLAYAILTVIAARERQWHTGNTDQALIPLTFNEIRRLFAKLIGTILYTPDGYMSAQLARPAPREVDPWGARRRSSASRTRCCLRSRCRRRDRPERPLSGTRWIMP